jgi:hypothetical protein
MEYLVLVDRGVPIGTYKTLLEALQVAKQKGRKLVIHRIHVKEGKWIVQEIGLG